MRSFCRVKARQFLSSFECHNIFNPIDVGDGPVDSGQEPATLVGIEFPGVGHHVVENVLGNDEIYHVIRFLMKSNCPVGWEAEKNISAKVGSAGYSKSPSSAAAAS